VAGIDGTACGQDRALAATEIRCRRTQNHAGRLCVRGEGGDHASRVDRRGLGGVEGLAAGLDPGFDASCLCLGDEIQRDPVGQAALQEIMQARQLGFVAGDDQLAGKVDRDAAFPAVGLEGTVPVEGEARLPRVRAVVEAGMQDPAVAPAVVPAAALLLLDKRHRAVPVVPLEVQGQTQSDDAPADHEEVGRRQVSGRVARQHRSFSLDSGSGR